MTAIRLLQESRREALLEGFVPATLVPSEWN
jgi:hypothetical protein